jgi:hypothetical protein
VLKAAPFFLFLFGSLVSRSDNLWIPACAGMTKLHFIAKNYKILSLKKIGSSSCLCSGDFSRNVKRLSSSSGSDLIIVILSGF